MGTGEKEKKHSRSTLVPREDKVPPSSLSRASRLSRVLASSSPSLIRTLFENFPPSRDLFFVG